MNIRVGKKIWPVFLAFLLGMAPGLGAQSLVELARKEKERRESLKDRKTVVVTNEDLAKVTKTPAIETSGVSAILNIIPEGEREAESEPQTPVRRIIPRVAASGPVFLKDGEPMDSPSPPGDPAERLRKAEEMVELLTLKMNALWQKFYNMDDMTTQDLVQQEISDTYEKLVKAQEEAARLRERAGIRDEF